MANLEKLFDHLQDEHGLILVDSEMQEIERIVLGTHQPFVFTDWLAEMGFENTIKATDCYWEKGNVVIFVLKSQIQADVDFKNVFTKCQIPTTPEQAAFLFKSFNLL